MSPVPPGLRPLAGMARSAAGGLFRRPLTVRISANLASAPVRWATRGIIYSARSGHDLH